MEKGVKKAWGIKQWLIFAAVMWALIIIFLIWVLGGSETTDSDDSTANKANAEIVIEGNGKLEMTVDRSNGELNINRPVSTGGYVTGDEDIWTIFVYLCGSDLESDCGLASADLQEMVDGVTGDSVRFVVETGGTKEWDSDIVVPDKLQRFLVTSDGLMEVDSQPLDGMGKATTLEDFLTWGTANYASEHMGVVLWNHGGGSVSGVCFDETTKDKDSLTLSELNQAFYPCFAQLGRKFDFVGFDACLMAGIENANIFATYADYMFASEETEPGGGWNYVQLGNYLSDNADTDMVELGKLICDGYLAACQEEPNGNTATISMIDLSKMDDLVKSFNSTSRDIFESVTDPADIANTTCGILWADDYGGNNDMEGYTNMVDLGGVLDAFSIYTDTATETRNILSDAIVYSVTSDMHPKASGISIFYPLMVPGTVDLENFSMVCVNPYYLAFIDRNCECGVGALTEVTDYDQEDLFDESGLWTYGVNNDTHWNYLADNTPTGESSYIDYAKEPKVENNSFGFTLGKRGHDFVSSIGFVVYEYLENSDDLVELGEVRDYNVDWDTGVVSDTLNGYWFSLPDGQNLATYAIDDTEDSIIFSSPIYLNDQKTNLRIRYNHADGSVKIEGVWDGIDESGAASRASAELQDGDVIVPAYKSSESTEDTELYVTGNEYTVSGELEIVYDLLEEGEYYASYNIYDVYGDYRTTSVAVFDVDENGNTFFR
ncbi:clostripain-related cysteine peptidase [Butyrivibrio sp. X503]|uniref:clostripain-related cysteine peptidase n=1 Tax=Butyrivibrio sp. X503 TaxID=2364878 RepID=UPI00131424B3|nr:clostripain-related cysteine peptidase [Butyrivibrio sp. X503]